jgi:hypothetical protein
MNKNWIIGGVLLVLLLLIGAWWLGWFHRDDPFVAEVKALAAQPQNKDNDNAMRDMMRERMQGLSEEQRMAMFEKVAPIFIPLMAARFEQEYDKFMALPEAERNKELDKRIAEMKRRGPPEGGGGGGARPNIDPKKMDEFRKKMLDWVTPEQRGKFQNGMQLFNARLQQQGMQPVSPPGGGFF